MNDTTERLSSLLRRQRSLLRSGDLDGLGSIIAEFEQLTNEVEAGAFPYSVLASARAEIQRNAQLCEASARGVASVIRRLEELRTGHSGHRVYDARGQKEVVKLGSGFGDRRV